MAITYTLSPNPHWVVVDNFSRLPAGAVIYTYSSLTPNQFKPAFQDQDGNIPYGQPIAGLGNGTFPPIYWAINDADPMDLYFIRVFDKLNIQGNDAVELWNINFFPKFSGGGGGGGGGTVVFDLENLVTNGEFYRNVGNLPVTPATSVPVNVTLAPSNHSAFTGVTHDVVNDGPVGNDIIFAKSNTNATDSISFTNFPNGDTSFSPSPTPQLYVNYTCSVIGSGETYKFFQFPLVKGLRNLEAVTISVAMWNQYMGGNNVITMRLRQFFGNGPSASADVVTNLGALQFSGGNWNRTIFNSAFVLSTSGKNFGECGNDALYLQIAIPTSAPINFNFILPSVYVGGITTSPSTPDFHTLDQVDAITNSPRTGDTRVTLNAFHDYGWVPANDGTIGSSTSGATTRANIDTFPLYELIWNSVSQGFAPVTGGRGASAVDDFSSNKSMALTRNLGRVMAGALPISATNTFTVNIVTNELTVPSTAGLYTGMAVTVSSTISLPAPLVANTTYFAIIINGTTMQLALTSGDAFAPTPIDITTTGSGTLTITSVYPETLGSYTGEEQHFVTQNELPRLLSSFNLGGTIVSVTSPGGISITSLGPPVGTPTPTASNSFGGGAPSSIIQPTVYMNVYFKL